MHEHALLLRFMYTACLVHIQANRIEKDPEKMASNALSLSGLSN